MELIHAYWIHGAIAILFYVIGKIHGRASAMSQMQWMRQEQERNRAFMQSINQIGGGHE